MAGHPNGNQHGEDASLPLMMEHWFVSLDRDRPEAVHAAEVVDTVHVDGVGSIAVATPIIESRVTSSASFSSGQPSVPVGCSGRTR